MIPVQFRPKYDVEQYVIHFQFPEETIGEDILLSVAAESGETPPSLSLGPIFRLQNNAFVVVAGGAAGEIYKISCSVGDISYEGLVAVKKSSANIPAGTAAAPFIKGVTTPPYATYIYDVLSTAAQSASGFHIQDPVDPISISVKALNGDHRLLIVTYENYPPEYISLGVHAADGTHSSVIQDYKNYPPESFAISAMAQSGMHKVEQIVYLNYAPESITVGARALNGQHAIA